MSATFTVKPWLSPPDKTSLPGWFEGVSVHRKLSSWIKGSVFCSRWFINSFRNGVVWYTFQVTVFEGLIWNAKSAAVDRQLMTEIAFLDLKQNPVMKQYTMDHLCRHFPRGIKGVLHVASRWNKDQHQANWFYLFCKVHVTRFVFLAGCFGLQLGANVQLQFRTDPSVQPGPTGRKHEMKLHEVADFSECAVTHAQSVSVQRSQTGSKMSFMIFWFAYLNQLKLPILLTPKFDK